MRYPGSVWLPSDRVKNTRSRVGMPAESGAPPDPPRDIASRDLRVPRGGRTGRTYTRPTRPTPEHLPRRFLQKSPKDFYWPASTGWHHRAKRGPRHAGKAISGGLAARAEAGRSARP